MVINMAIIGSSVVQIHICFVNPFIYWDQVMARGLNVGDNIDLCNSMSNIKKMRIAFGKLKDAMLVLIFGLFGIKNHQHFTINWC